MIHHYISSLYYATFVRDRRSFCFILSKVFSIILAFGLSSSLLSFSKRFAPAVLLNPSIFLKYSLFLDCDPLTGPNTTFWEILKDNKVVGKTTSAVYSPRLKQNIALAMVSIDNSEIGTLLDVKMNDKIVKATVAEKPFYDPKKKLASS